MALPPERPPIDTDAVVIGAGPVGLFQVFQLGLQDLRTHLIDALPYAGGQCAELYPDKPIYDIPGLPVVTGQELTERLQRQIQPFATPVHLGLQVTGLQRQPDGRWLLTAGQSQAEPTRWLSRVVVIAAGVGAFMPRRATLKALEAFEGSQVLYHHHAMTPAARNPQRHRVVMGGDEAAVELALELALELAGAQALEDGAPQSADVPPVVLLHRTDKLSLGASLQAAWQAALDAGRVRLVVGQPVGLQTAPESGDSPNPTPTLTALELATPNGTTQWLPTDVLLPRLGLSPKLGPVAEWGLAMERKHLVVDTAGFATSEPGIFAVGDVNTYPGKKKLIVCGFHEATLAAYAAAAVLRPNEREMLQYTTTSPRLQQLLGVLPAGKEEPAAQSGP